VYSEEEKDWTKMKSPKTDDLIALICKAATEKYSSGPNGDRVRPGIQIAHIPAEPDPKAVSFGLAGGMSREAVAEAVAEAVIDEPAFWYVALHRYPNPPRGQSMPTDALGRVLPPACPEVRVIAFKAQHEDLDRAVQLLALQLLPVEAQAELAEAIRGVKAP
jgi:hypothetical protein